MLDAFQRIWLLMLSKQKERAVVLSPAELRVALTHKLDEEARKREMRTALWWGEGSVNRRRELASALMAVFKRSGPRKVKRDGTNASLLCDDNICLYKLPTISP